MENNVIQSNRFEDYYMNLMQIRANVVDANTQIVEVARAGGKTRVYLALVLLRLRMICRELAFLVHKTYTTFI